MNVLCVIDLGSSLTKVVYTSPSGKPEPLALRPEFGPVTLAQIESQMGEYSDDAVSSAWIEWDGKYYAGGTFAAESSGRQYHELSKWTDLLPRLLMLFGLVCDRHQTDSCTITVGLLLPRDEVNLTDREALLSAIAAAATSFQFRGQSLHCNVELKVATEGAGLFAAHAAYLRTQGIPPAQTDIPVIMGGERNTSLITFRAGKVNPALSSSGGDGFYKFATQLRQAIGASVSLPELITAIAHRRDRLRIVGGDFIDLQPHVVEALESYTQSILRYLKAKLPTGEIQVICGGGACHLIWNHLEPFFHDLSIPASYLNPLLDVELTQLCRGTHLQLDPTTPTRFADALGLYKAMAERLRKATEQPQSLAMR